MNSIWCIPGHASAIVDGNRLMQFLTFRRAVANSGANEPIDTDLPPLESRITTEDIKP